jgi:hypothetical protein
MFKRLLAVASFFSCGIAIGDVGLIMNETTGKGTSRFTAAGHSAVYFSNICPASPVKLRLCHPGEEGSILSTYTNFAETSDYEWNIVPLSQFLYGVDDSSDAPLYGNEAALKLLREQYRKSRLDEICPPSSCGSATYARWRDLVGVTFGRKVYLFRMKTSTEQDKRLVEEFNLLPNENHYNGFTRNCADFARKVVNRYFPNAAKPDHLNDFGMTSPKAISKSFTQYGAARPELQFVAERFDQLPGQMPRSSPCRKGTEASFRLKKWLIPLLAFGHHELAAFFVAYTLTGRFNPDRAVKRYPGEEMGSDPFWKNYGIAFRGVLDTALREGVFADGADVKSYFKELDRVGHVKLDDGGLPVLEVNGRLVGLSRGNLLAAGSDPLLGFQLMLARVQTSLKAPAARRESGADFKKDWDLLMRAQERFSVMAN